MNILKGNISNCNGFLRQISGYLQGDCTIRGIHMRIYSIKINSPDSISVER